MTRLSEFESNVELFALWQPHIAIQLSRISPKRSSLLRSSAAEASRWFKTLDLSDSELLYVFGVGDGHYYEATRKWLHQDSKRCLVFLEDDLGVLKRLLQDPISRTILQDPQVRLYAFSDVEADDLLFNNLAWDYVLKPFKVSALRLYANKRPRQLERLRERLTYEHHRKGEIAEEYLDQGIVFYQNFYPNVLRLGDGYLGDGLFNRFQGVPAIICGAGPSLHKQLPLLRTLQDRALIFAGGSALNALTAQNILPHFSCGIDPNFPQYQRLIHQTGFEVPFFFRSRMNQRACQVIHGPRLYVTGTGGYETASYFEQRLGLPESRLDEGHNVVNLCVSIAQAMGCNPLIFVGLDLAYTNMRGYAPGIVSNEVVTVEQISQTGIDHAAVLRRDIYNQPIYTLWKWIDESQWIADFAEAHPKLTLINATEGGIGIPGVPNQPFEKVVDTRLQSMGDLRGKVWAAIQSAVLPPGTQQTMLETCQYLKASLIRCQRHLDQLLDHLREGTYSIGVQALTDMELEEEIGFHAVLNTFNTCINRLLLREQRELECNRGKLTPKEIEKKQIALLKKHYQFLSKVAKSNCALIDHACKLRKKEQQIPALIASHSGKQFKMKSSYRNKQLHGPSRVWDAKGLLLSECYYVKGLREGIAHRYYANGTQYAEESYEEGLLRTGRYFYPNGRTKTELDYCKGVAKTYHPDGKLKRRYQLERSE